MTANGRRWRIRLTAAAEADFRNILLWTSEQFGQAQARSYAETLSLALEALMAGPNVAGSRRRDDIAKGLMTMHVARKGRNAKHLVTYRVGKRDDPPTIDILRLLHDSMDLVRHVESETKV